MKFKKKFKDILVYQFAADLKDVDWQNSNLVTIILNTLRISHDYLHGKTLILDGFDEISAGNNRKDILDYLYRYFIIKDDVKNFTLIITCRENYIRGFERLKCEYIILHPWNEEQIRSFCKKFVEKTNKNISEYTIKHILENKVILGVPLILYMVLALDINIDKESSIVDIYDKIFSLEGGIYDRCIENKSFDDIHRIGDMKKQIHQISREIALWMFENNSDEASIYHNEYEKICINVMQESKQKCEDIKQDFMIGNYFKLVKHCEGIETEKLYFVHRSIYEYFVTEYIYSSICEAIEISKKELACVFGKLLKGNSLSKQILKFLKYKIKNSELKNAFDFAYETCQLMLQDGMMYYTNKYFKNTIKCEMFVFANMLEILRLWENEHLKFDNLIRLYLNNNTEYGLSLRGLNLSNVDLSRTNLSDADLRGANLKGVKLEKSNLKGANLKGADLRDVDLRDADLRDVKLNGTKLKGTILSIGQVDFLKRRNDLKGVIVYIEKTNTFISYKEYCKKGDSYFEDILNKNE